MACVRHPVHAIIVWIVRCSKKVLQHALNRSHPLLGLLGLLRLFRGLHQLFKKHVNVTIDIGLIVTAICNGDLQLCHIFSVTQYPLQSVLDTKYMTIEHAQFEEHSKETSTLFVLLVCQAIQLVDEGSDKHFVKSLFNYEWVYEYGLLVQIWEGNDRAGKEPGAICTSVDDFLDDVHQALIG